MIIVLKKSVKYFIYMFIVIEVLPFILKIGSTDDILIQSLALIIISIAIAYRNYKKEQKKSNELVK